METAVKSTDSADYGLGLAIFVTETPPTDEQKHLFHPLFPRNPHFPALRVSPMAFSGATRKSKFLAVMKKKTRITTAAKTPLDTLRKTSSYPGARVMFGLPFLVFGCLYLLTGGWLVITSVADAFGGDTGAATAFLSLAAGALCFIAGLFFIGVTFLADAITPISPPSGSPRWLFQEPPAKANS
jgi:hypothetical protein